jgi:hypothetical protein
MLAGFQTTKKLSQFKFTEVAYRSTGATSAGTTSCTPGLPAGVVKGDGLLMHVGSKLQAPIVDTPSGWRRIGENIVGTLGNGQDTGPIRNTLFFREADGTEASTVSVNLPNGNSVMGTIHAYSKDPWLHWNIEVFGGEQKTVTTSWVINSYGKFSTKKGDMLASFISINTEAYPLNSQSAVQAGLTFQATTEVFDSGTQQGNDQRQVVSNHKVLFGSAFEKLNYTLTAEGTSPTAPIGPIGSLLFVRLRQSNTPTTFLPSGLRIWDPDLVSEPNYSNLAAEPALWDGLQADFQDTPNYSITTYGGKKWFTFFVDFTTAPAVDNRRTEVYPISWTPNLAPGTEEIWGFSIHTDSTYVQALGGIIFLQSHPGASGRPSPNHPAWALEIGYAGQFGGVPAGCLIIHRGIPTRVYEKVTSVQFAPSTRYDFLVHVKHDYAGSAALKVRVNGVWVMKDFTNATIATLAEDLGDGVGTGSNPNVGGAMKHAIYHHMIEDESDILANVAAGCNGLTLRYRKFKWIRRNPTDPDYTTDFTADNNPAYAYVDTSND